jgi:hypothetical protein
MLMDGEGTDHKRKDQYQEMHKSGYSCPCDHSPHHALLRISTIHKCQDLKIKHSQNFLKTNQFRSSSIDQAHKNMLMNYMEADGSWWVPRTSNPVCGATSVAGGFDSHALPPYYFQYLWIITYPTLTLFD